MWSSIADLKENLNKIAHDVHNDDEGLPINGLDDGHDSTYSDRRLSHSFSNSKSVSVSPMSNGITPAYNSEIEQYKADIKKLRESEAEIKALSVNYATLLREKEDQIARLNQENGSLRKNLENASRGSTASPNVLKVIGDQSPNRQHKLAAQVKNRPTANQWHNVVPKQDGHNNGFAYAIQADPESNCLNSRGGEKELVDLLEEKNRSLAAMQASYEPQIQQLRVDLEKEQERSASIQLKLQDEQKLRHSFQEELNSLKLEHNKASIEINRLCEELNDKVSEIKRLQTELDRREDQEADGMDGLKRVAATLEEEKMKLKMEKEELEATVKTSTSSSAANIISDASGTVNKQLNNLDEIGHSLGSSLVKGELERSLQKLEKDLKETCRQRDKALQELARLKQHLLDKESEESEKMDEDGKIIEELRQNVEYQKATIVNLERALQQAYANQEEVKSINNSELQKSKEIIDDLKEKLSGCMRMIDAKNVELLNLQTALGQYYAEIEAKEHLEGNLYVAREECIKLSQLLKDSNEQVEVSRREKDEILAKLAQVETMVSEGKSRVNKLEEDNVKLQRALEQSMTRLNRMSMDSDFLVDSYFFLGGSANLDEFVRRIVIKLLVTYFQRNHSKEVLDLMVRMLGFTDEDKQRIGIAQQGAGKGAVRGVLGLPGRLVGGILSRSSSGEQINATSENQSFADLWVDFLLTESEKRERRESMDSAGGTKGTPDVTSPSAMAIPPPPDHRSSEMKHTAVFLSIQKPPLDQASRTPYNYPSIQQYEHTGSEFSTVPLTPSQNNSWSQK